MKKILLIGTSPAMLLEAILLSKKYRNIEIHEKSSSMGGSWKTRNFFEIKNVETGSHIFAPWRNRFIYNQCQNILKKKFKLRTYFLKPAPSNIVNHNLKKKEESKIRYFYVKGGIEEILKFLKKKIKNLKIKVILNSNIRKISLKKNIKKIYSNKGITYADEVYLPEYCKLDFNNEKTFERRKSIHVLLEILNKKKIKKKISYVQKVNFSKIFDRLSDLSNIYNLKNNIYCLRLSRLGKEKLKKYKKNLIKELSYDLIYFLNGKSDNNLEIRYKLYYYETSFREKKNLILFKKFIKKNKCRLVNTGEFIKYMSQNLKRLKSI